MKNRSLLRILTFNWHEAYLSMLAETGYEFHAVQVEKGGHYGWQTSMRPIPKNITLLSEGDALEKLREGHFHLVVCHNMRDVLTVEEVSIPKILIFHNKISTEIALGGHRISAGQYRGLIRERIAKDRLTLVFISESKRENCGLDGPVVPPGINVMYYGGYRGEIEKVLRVGNLMKERDIMLGFSWQEEILTAIPSTLLGINRALPESKVSESWEDLKTHYRSHRVFLNTTLHPWEDGYNLAMLEAMATGMPVVSITNPTSPIVDGVNGYISQDIGRLRRRIQELLSDRDRAAELGLGGRETVKSHFPMAPFVEKWIRLFEEALNRSTKPLAPRTRIGKKSDQTTGRTVANRKVLLSYTSNPVTTARYLEKSLRKDHNVMTCGPSITPERIEAWNLVHMKEKPKPHDFDLESVNLKTVTASLGNRWRPDFFLWVESGIWFPLEGLELLECPKACYLIDTHLHPDLHINWASQFDVVFLAQKAYIPLFHDAGIEDVFWLPLACDPDFHGNRKVKKRYDIGFVGSILPENPRRTALLDRLSKRFDVYVERCFLRDMARVFSASKIVFNNAIRNDLNMRVFEGLCSGSLLLTDRAEGSGLEEFFCNKTHLVIYDDENLEDLAQYYLAHGKERNAIAARGRKEVLRRHTYDHRAQEIVDRMESLTLSRVHRSNLKTVRGEREGSDRSSSERQADASSHESGERLEQLGCLIEARDHYLERMERNPGDTCALVGLGRVLMKLEQWKDAASYLQRAVDMDPQWEPLVLLARCEMKLGNPDEALVYLEKASGHESRDTSRHREVLILLGDCLAQMGEFHMAEAHYRQVIDSDEHSDDAWTGLGVLHTLREDYHEADKAFTRAVDINPRNDRALCGLGMALWNTGHKENAFDHLRKSLNVNPENLTCLGHLLRCSYENGRLDVTEKYLKQYLDLHPLNIDVLYSLGGLYYRLQKDGKVQEVVETIQAFQPDHEGAKELASLVSRRTERRSQPDQATKSV